jgi:NAD-dependent dihydropyrimidine dehydrogenase PreA subunit
VIDMLAVVDHTKCTACYACVAVCPQDCIDVTGSRAARSVAVTDGAADGFDGFVATASADTVAEEDA